MDLGTGKMSTFGGPDDLGMAPNEGLALYEFATLGMDAYGVPLFLEDSKFRGEGRSLNPAACYIAMRWDYAVLPTRLLRQLLVKVSVGPSNARKWVYCTPVDWGPAEHTGRICDLSPGAAARLGVKTDYVVTCSI